VPLAVKRVHEAPARGDGQRVLVDRLWPRGVSKERAAVHLWAREAAPSAELRRWFDHDPERWEGFRARYARELDARPEALEPILARARRGRVTLVYGSRETRFNNAVALREYLAERLGEPRGAATPESWEPEPPAPRTSDAWGSG
jgi:uncharacterized protein YeaO (DUF488 family)